MAVCMDESSASLFIPADPEEEEDEEDEGTVQRVEEEAYREKLVHACRSNDTSQVKSILEGLLADKRDPGPILNLRNQDGTTPLHEACLHGSVDCIPVLLKHGREANIFDSRGFAPIHCAACNNHTDAMKALLDYQPLDENCTKCQPDQGSAYRETPLHVACLQGHLAAVQLLCEMHTSLSCVDVVGNTFLHCVSASDSKELWGWALLVLQQSLLEGFFSTEGCPPDLWKKKNMYGWTPTHIAASMGCKNSISALLQLKADFTVTDKHGLSSLDIMNQRSHTDCHDIATKKQKAEFIPTKLTLSPLLTTQNACRSRSSSGHSIKLTRKPSITGQERPMTIKVQSSHSASSASVLRRSASVRSRASSIDSILSFSKDIARLKGASSEDKILQFVAKVYEPPFDSVPPICKEVLTPTKSSLGCVEHGIVFSTKLFAEMANHRQNNEQDFVRPKPNEVEVHLAVSMHIHTPFPDKYTIVSPICFVSCRCPRIPFSLTLPHAVDMSTDLVNKASFKILSVTCDVHSSTIVSPMSEIPPGKELEEFAECLIKVYSEKVKFTTSIRSPTLFAVGIKNDAGTRVPSPLPVLLCTLFCMYENYSEHSSISHIPVKMYVGLRIDTVRKIMLDESTRKNSILKEVHFSLKEEKFSLRANLTCSKEDWKLDTEEAQEMSYCHVALTRDTDQLPYTHKLSYPPQQTVHILPKSMANPATCEVSLLDTNLQLITKIQLMPYAPYRSATHTPMGTPPPPTSVAQQPSQTSITSSPTKDLPRDRSALVFSDNTPPPPHNTLHSSQKAHTLHEEEIETIISKRSHLRKVSLSVNTVV